MRQTPLVRMPEFENPLSRRRYRACAFTCLSRSEKMMERQENFGDIKIMPLSGEAIRMMNYIDDVSTTLRHILALVPTLTTEERHRVGEYLKHANPGVDAVIQALNAV